MFRSEANRIGYIILAIILLFGTFCLYDLNRMLNLKSEIIGYFKHTETATKINDFEYDIQQLLFTNSGSNENEFFAEVLLSDVITGFDGTKNYNLLINNNETTRVNGNYGYINVDFMNIFNSTQDSILLTDTLNIKINFYKDSTKIVFITRGGEQAVKLWTGFIQKNGFNLKIIENDFDSTIEVDSLTEDGVLLLQAQLNNKIEQYKSLTDASEKIRCIDEINKLSALISKSNGYFSNTEAYKQLIANTGFLFSFDRFGSDEDGWEFDLTNIEHSSFSVIENATIYSTTTIPDYYFMVSNDELANDYKNVSHSIFNCNTFIPTEDATDIYDLLGYYICDFNDEFWNFNNIVGYGRAGFYPELSSSTKKEYGGLYRTDFENKEKYSTYNVQYSSFICLKSTSTDFIKSFLKYLYSSVENEYNQTQLDEFTLKLDISEYFNNFTNVNGKYVLSNGSVYIDIEMNHWN